MIVPFKRGVYEQVVTAFALTARAFKANMASLAIIGGGGRPGFFAAERLAGAGHSVTIFDRMPSPGRKFLMAGRGG